MSSSPTAPTSTTASSTSSPSPAERRPTRPGGPDRLRRDRPALRRGGRRHGWPVDVHPLPPLLHNQPRADRRRGRPARGELRAALRDGRGRLRRLRHLRRPRRGLRAARPERLDGLHCYDVYAGAGPGPHMFDEQPGTYVLTDFLVRSFDRTVIAELGPAPSCATTTSPLHADRVARPHGTPRSLGRRPDGAAARIAPAHGDGPGPAQPRRLTASAGRGRTVARPRSPRPGRRCRRGGGG